MSEVVPFLQLMVTAMVPFILAAQGTMLGGRAGIFNVAQEGVMVLGASVGFLVSLKAGGNLVGLVAAALAGAVFGLVLGWTTTRFRLDQFVIGLALFFAATGLASLLYKVVIEVTLTPPLINTLQDWKIPLLGDIPVLGPVLFHQDGMVYFAFVLSGALYWLLTGRTSASSCGRWGRTPRRRTAWASTSPARAS